MWLKDCEKSCTHPLVFHSKKRLHSSENRSLLSHKSQGLEIWDLGRQLEVCWRVRWQTCIWTHPKLMVVCQHPLVSQNTLTTNLIFLSISKFPLLINKYINNIRLEAHSHYCVIECHCFYNSLYLNLRVIFGDKEGDWVTTCGITGSYFPPDVTYLYRFSCSCIMDTVPLHIKSRGLFHA